MARSIMSMMGWDDCGRRRLLLQSWKSYVAMITLQFGYAGMNIITKKSLNGGMSHYVLVVYRQAFATLSIAPFALVLERKVRPKMTVRVFLQIFLMGLLGSVIVQNFYFAGLKFTSPTFSSAITNILPALTFVMAVLSRMEKVEMKKARWQAKVAGTAVTVAGAMVMIFYKGPVVDLIWNDGSHSPPASNAPPMAADDKEWFKGSIFLIVATWSWAAFFIVQAYTLKRYSAQLSLTALVCFLGTLQSIPVTFVMEHSTTVWRIGWDINLLAAAYAGVVTSSIAYYVQGLVINKKGPVFASAFSPLMMIIVAVMGAFILAERIYLGGVIGGILIVVGLASVLWGKHKDVQDKQETPPLPVNDIVDQENAGGPQCLEVTRVDEIDLERAKMRNSNVVAPLDDAVVPEQSKNLWCS